MNWRKYLRRSRRDREMAREIESYLAEETADNVARGMPPVDARLAALRKFGNRTLIREEQFEMNTLAWFDRGWQDLKYGLRQIRLQPGFAFAAVLSLALGIGANTAIFTLVDQILLRAMPVENPRELVQLRVDGGRFGGNSGDGIHTFPYPTYAYLRDHHNVFRGITGQRVEGVSLTEGDRNEIVTAGLVAGNYFEVMGVKAAFGRTLTPEDDQNLNAHPVAVLQYDFWQTRFDGRANAVGQTIRLNGLPFTIVGVAAPGYEGTDVGFPNRLWVPVSMRPTMTPSTPRLDEPRQAWFYPFARLKPGVTLAQAEAEMKVLYRQRQQEELNHQIFSQFPQLKDRFLRQTFSLEPAASGDSSLRRLLARPLIILEWLVGAVLLIACANVAGLLLARGAARQRELAIRGAIGAGRGRIVSQLLAESLLLAVAGGAAGLLLGAWLTRVLISSLPFDPGNFTLSSAPDGRVLAFTVAVTALTAIVFGLLPAWQNSGVAPALTLRQEAGSIAGGSAQVRLRKIFVALQVGLSVLLLLGAGLFVRTLSNLRQVDLGMKTEQVITFGVSPVSNLTEAQKIALYQSVIESLATVRGVEAVGANVQRLFTGGRADGSVTIPGVDEKKEPDSFFNWVTPGYFEALGIPVKVGRAFTWRDWNSGRKIAVVNERLAGEYYGGSPVGRSIGRGMRVPADYEIIGVIGDARYHDVRGEVPRQTFFNLDSQAKFMRGLNVYARTKGDPRPVMAALRAQVRQLDSSLVVYEMRTLDEQLNLRLANERLVSFLSMAFAMLATLLAIVGLHGVLAYVVARRTREIGIRVALGAERASVIGLVAREMLAYVTGGLVVGAAAGYYLARFVESQLFGVKANDPVVFASAIGTLVAAAVAATLIPAWQASRIDPLRALRYE